MNNQHLSETGEWYTPPRWIEAARRALGSIDLDPCSSRKANECIVTAGTFLRAAHEPLQLSWHQRTDIKTAFVNPPGACQKVGPLYSVCGNRNRCSCALPRDFMAKSMIEAYHGMNIIYLAYSVNQLRQITRLIPPMALGISIAIPKDRIPYIDPSTMEPVKGTNCDSAFVCFSMQEDMHDRFFKAFGPEGCEVFRRV